MYHARVGGCVSASGAGQLLADEVVSSLDNPGTVSWAMGDHLNSVREVVDSNGNSIAHLVYDSFGKLAVGTNPLLFGYTGRPLDADTGLQNNLNRWYDARVGRWLSEDPIGYRGGINLYEYCRDNPVLYVDPSGLFSKIRDFSKERETKIVALEKLAQEQIAALKKEIEAARGRVAKLDVLTRARLWNANRILDTASKKLKEGTACYDKKLKAFAMAWPWGNTVYISESFFLLKEKAQAAALVHEGTHMGAATTDLTYFWQNRKSPATTLGIGWDIIASTYDSWIMNGFFVPGVDADPKAVPDPLSWLIQGADPKTPLVPPPDFDNPNAPKTNPDGTKVPPPPPPNP